MKWMKKQLKLLVISTQQIIDTTVKLCFGLRVYQLVFFLGNLFFGIWNKLNLSILLWLPYDLAQVVGKRDQKKEFQKLVTFGEPRLTHNGQIGRALDRDGISFGRDSKPLLSIQAILKGKETVHTTERYIAKGALVHGP